MIIWKACVPRNRNGAGNEHRKRSRRRLEAIDQELLAASPIDELLLIQERKNLEAERSAMSNSIDMEALEHEFVGVAKSYSDGKAISYSSWRDVGVPASVLKAAGINRSD